MWIVLVKSKVEVAPKVQQFITVIQNQHNTTPKTLRIDNGPEFLLTYFYAANGLNHQKSCVKTPKKNGRVERKHQHLLNVGRALLYQSKLPKTYWSYALLYDAFIINRVSSTILNHQPPYHIFHDKLPDIESFKVFGSLFYASSLSVHRTKLDPKARKSLFLSCPPYMKGYILLDLNTKEVFNSRHVSFHEHILPYTTQTPQSCQSWTYYHSSSND